MRRPRVSLLVAAGLAVRLLGVAPAGAATITVINNDGPGEGLNDPTPVAAVGGNSCGTLGAQRLRALQFAADIWADLVASNLEIRIGATFDALFCTNNTAILGQAGPVTYRRDFVGAPVAGTWYPIGLANALNGTDLDAGNDIVSFFNSGVDAGCGPSFRFYYGLDSNPPGNDIDLVAVALHEFGHGLGFLTLVDKATGAKALGFDDAYMLNLEDHSTAELWPAMTDAERVASAIDTNDLHWVGAAVVTAGAGLTGGREPISGHVEMYAPNPLGGSSVAHWSTTLTPNEIMEPFYTSALNDPGLAYEAMLDIGWPSVAPGCGDAVVQAAEGCDDGDTTDGDGCSHRCTVEQCYTCVGAGPSVCTPVLDGTACDDGSACSQTDTCQGGVCTGANPVDCSSPDTCIAAGTCDVCSGDCAVGLPTCIDPFLCYTVKTTLGAAKFTPELALSLADEFEASLTADATKPKHVCTPADDGGGTLDPATHVESYRLKPAVGTPKFIAETSITVTNTLGAVTVDATKRELLLVPTAKDPNVDPPAPVFGAHEVDHYKCYKVKISKGEPKFPRGLQTTVSDQFTTPKILDVKKPLLLCTPVDTNGSTIKHPLVRQMCYTVKPAVGQPKHVAQVGLHLSNEFGPPVERLNTKRENIFCLPSVTSP